MIFLDLDITPTPKGRPRFSGRGAPYTPARTRKFESELQALVRKKYLGLPLEGEVMLSVVFTNKRKITARPDIDNLVKAVTDALNGILWKDDSQIVSLSAEKRYGESGRITLLVAKGNIHESHPQGIITP